MRGKKAEDTRPKKKKTKEVKTVKRMDQKLISSKLKPLDRTPEYLETVLEVCEMLKDTERFVDELPKRMENYQNSLRVCGLLKPLQKGELTRDDLERAVRWRLRNVHRRMV